MASDILHRLKKLEEKTPTEFILLCREPDGTEREATAREYQDDLSLVFIRGLRGSRFSDMVRFVEGNKRRAAAILTGEYEYQRQA